MSLVTNYKPNFSGHLYTTGYLKRYVDCRGSIIDSPIFIIGESKFLTMFSR